MYRAAGEFPAAVSYSRVTRLDAVFLINLTEI